MELVIRVMWCKGLTAFNFFQKLTLYTSVSIICEDPKVKFNQNYKQEQKTHVDQQGDGNPEWNYPMKFDLKSLIPINSDFNFQDLSLLFELRDYNQLFGDKIIGEVRVPLKNLIDSVGVEVVRFVSYEIRNPDGKQNGILDFSYKIIGDLGIRNDHDNDYYQCSSWNPEKYNYPKIEEEELSANHHDNDYYQFSSWNPENFQYPKINVEELNANHIPSSPPPPLVGGDFRPPGSPPLWAPPPPQPLHFWPPPVFYPPPPFGDPHMPHHGPPRYDYHHW